MSFDLANENLKLLPLYLDAANPSPDQGWLQIERKGLSARRGADGLLALALVHHLAIGKNIPLESVAQWLTSLAPQGIIEFVSKQDPMVEDMLRLREDIFVDYDLEHFERYIRKRAEIVKSVNIQNSHRQLIWYKIS